MRSKQTNSGKRVAQTAPLVGWRFLGLLGFSLIAVLWLGKVPLRQIRSLSHMESQVLVS